MKSFSTIAFLVTAGSFVSGTPAFRGENKTLSSPINLAARALDLVPRHKVEAKHPNANETVKAAESLLSKAENSTEAEAHPLFVRHSTNINITETGTEKRSPSLRRSHHWEMRSQNGTNV
ncbi:hypothetical protein GGR52DRAFT_210422 [Hypoxylon sp. FL1284]|nr:hypothetical protein GGR52DRAFT_210422 [Hypoxylon sp. FL1284]